MTADPAALLARMNQTRDDARLALGYALAYLADRARQGDAVAGEIHDMVERSLDAVTTTNLEARWLLEEARSP